MNTHSSTPSLSNELVAVRDFLAECAPFDALPENELASLARKLTVQYFRKGQQFTLNENESGLRIIRSGAGELRDSNNELIDRFGESVSFNLKGLNQESAGVHAVLIEDSLVYFLAEDEYQWLRKQYRFVDRFFHHQRSRRIRRSVLQRDLVQQADIAYTSGSVNDIMARDVLTVTPQTSIQATAKRMKEARVSSALVVEQDRLLGVVTDRDIRSRAVAVGLNTSSPIDSIMTNNPIAINIDATLFDATLLMIENGIHHAPVLDNDKLVGIITTSDLILARQNDPVSFVRNINRQPSVEALVNISKGIPALFIKWVSQNVKSAQISHILTAISDAITRRLIELAIEKFGDAPVSFCWLGFGSQGRREQLLGADQDNGLIIDNDVSDHDKAWFEQLAQFVSDGLNACGYVYCPGKVMATTNEWRQSLLGWQHTVDKWTRTPTPKAVMHVSIFFDLRCIYGEQSLCDSLQQHMLNKTQGNSIFLAALAENILDNRPPLGFFRQFVVDRNGEHRDELNLKKAAIIPLVDIARIHALANGLKSVNTYDRLEEILKNRLMAKEDNRNLRDALEIVSRIRLENQVEQINNGEKPSNYFNPDRLSSIERKQLKDAFSIVQDAQQSIKMHFRPGI